MAATSNSLEALKVALGPAIERQRQYRGALGYSAALLLVVLVIVFGGALGLSRTPLGFISSTLLVGFGALLVAYWFAYKSAPDYRSLAHSIESRHPDLQGLLTTALEQQPKDRGGSLNFLQQRVLVQAIAESRRRQWLDVVPGWRIWGARLVDGVLVCAILAAATHVALTEATPTPGTPLAMADGVEVTPGDADLERGSSLIFTAKFAGQPPTEAAALLQPAAGEAQRIVLQQSLRDPLFGGALPEVKSDLTYHIDYGGKQTRDFHIHVFEFPRLERADAHLQYPAYTKLPDKEIADTTRVSAVEGTQLDLKLQLNKAVKSAALVAKDGTTLPLAVAPGQPLAELKGHVPKKSETYELRLEDSEGRLSKVPATFALDVLANRKPEIKIITPKGDQRVSPLQEVAFQAEVWDDFGLPAYGVTYTVAGGETKEVALGREVAGDQRTRGQLLLKMEELGLAPDQLISWFAWAEDTGPDGQPRRTQSDLYFAEVRPFEEIFRPGDPPPEGGGSGAAAPAAKFAEIQKQIIAATWNLKRTEEGRAEPGKLSPAYVKDEPVIRDSQKHAEGMAEALKEKLEDPKSKGLADAVIQEMQRAIAKLEPAATSLAPLPEALEAEQGAYNALLKLAAHEFRVSKSPKGKGQGSAEQDRKPQLDQLELKDEEKRYETQKEASPEQKQEQKEQLAILSRLKELAQRQHDINERLQELQTALQEAKTEAQKEEIKKQLKRLQEEEQRMLAESDELQQKMQAQNDPSKYSDEKKQLEQSRNEAQRTAEAMRQEKPGEALASGTRTERDLQKLRDDFRQKSSAQFNDQMRRMRTEARELASTQKELTEQLDHESDPQKIGERPTLDGGNPRDQIAEQIDKQQDRLKGLQGEMKEVSERAEAAEPLLSKELYDTLRKNAQANTDDTLQKTAMLAKRGYAPQAKQLGEKAGKDIDELKSGVERAAEAVLGNEEESIRQARAELDALTAQLNREIAQAAPQLAENTKGQTRGEQPETKAGEQGSGREKGEGKGQAPGEGKEPGEGKGQGEKGQGQGEGKGQGEKGQGQGEGKGQGEKGQGQGEGKGQGEKGQGQGEGKGQGEKGQGQGEGKGQGEKGQGQGEGKGQGEKGQGQGEGKGQGEKGQGQGEGKGQGEKGQGQGEGKGQGEKGQGQGEGEGQGEKGQGQGEGEGQGEKGQGQGEGKGQGQGKGQGEGSSGGGRSQPGEGLRQMAERAGQRAGTASAAGGGGGGANGGGGLDMLQGPIRGDGFVQWADRLRNVEEMVDNQEIRNEVARVREMARAERAEFKRSSQEPKWDMVKSQISKPLAELRDRLSEELARRESKQSLVPIDRDPVPPKYAEQVQKYYEVLGSGGKVAEPKKAE